MKTFLRQQVFLVLVGLFFCSGILAQESTDSSAAGEVQKADEGKADQDSGDENKTKFRVREIDLNGFYVDLKQRQSFDPMQLLSGGLMPGQKSFYQLIDFMDELAEGDDFDGVVFDMSSLFIMNPAQHAEFNRHLEKLSKAKQTYAWVESVTNGPLMVASHCDKVVMADFGTVDVPSAAMQHMYFGDAFDLLGLKASVVRAGNFKGAVEPYTEPKMSSHLRKQYMDMLESLNDSRIELIARGRGLKKKQIRDIQRQRTLLPKEALEQGLVDILAPYGSMEKTIREHIGKDVEWVTAKKTKKSLSFFELMNKLIGSSSSSKRFKKNTIAVMHLSGAIVSGKKPSSGSIVAGPTIEMIEKITNDENVKGVVIRINSPGGSATASEEIRQALLGLVEAKPTVISMGQVAASGGYWISCIDSPIFAEKGTITGSIGVFAMKLGSDTLKRRLGLHTEYLSLDDSANRNGRDWTESDKKTLQKSIDRVYDKFVDLVSNARGISTEKLREDLAGGRVWSGTQALENGLIDHLGGTDNCVDFIAKKAGLEGKFNVAHRPLPKRGLDLEAYLGSGDSDEVWSMGVPLSTLRWLGGEGFDLRRIKLLLEDNSQNRGIPTVWALIPGELKIE